MMKSVIKTLSVKLVSIFCPSVYHNVTHLCQCVHEIKCYVLSFRAFLDVGGANESIAARDGHDRDATRLARVEPETRHSRHELRHRRQGHAATRSRRTTEAYRGRRGRTNYKVCRNFLACFPLRHYSMSCLRPVI